MWEFVEPLMHWNKTNLPCEENCRTFIGMDQLTDPSYDGICWVHLPMIWINVIDPFEEDVD